MMASLFQILLEHRLNLLNDVTDDLNDVTDNSVRISASELKTNLQSSSDSKLSEGCGNLERRGRIESIGFHLLS